MSYYLKTFGFPLYNYILSWCVIKVVSPVRWLSVSLQWVHSILFLWHQKRRRLDETQRSNFPVGTLKFSAPYCHLLSDINEAMSLLCDNPLAEAADAQFPFWDCKSVCSGKTPWLNLLAEPRGGTCFLPPTGHSSRGADSCLRGCPHQLFTAPHLCQTIISIGVQNHCYGTLLNLVKIFSLTLKQHSKL